LVDQSLMSRQTNHYLTAVPPTPLVPIRLDPASPTVWCKLEFMQPSGSTKDRIARHILAKALDAGRLKPGGRVIEASSGSSAVAFALACSQLRLRFVAVMPEGVSPDRVRIIRAYGHEVRLTSAGVVGAVAESVRIATEPGDFLPRQFDNPDNPEAHQLSTAAEILAQIPDLKIHAVVSGVGTGGTLVGLHAGLRPANPGIRPFVARPVELPDSLEAECCSLGVGNATFSPRIPGVVECASGIFNQAQLPDLGVIDVPYTDALEVTRKLIRLGFPVGPSSGLNFQAAVLAFAQLNEPDANILTVFPDRMERHLTGELFRDPG
jgi:cysteine synthase